MLQNLVKRFCALALLACAGGCANLAGAVFKPTVNTEPTALRPGAYALDPNHAALLFKAGHLGFSKFVGRFERFDVSLDFDEKNPAASRIEAVIDMTSLDVANDDFANVLMGPNWFDAGQFPEAQFHSTGVAVTGDNTGHLTGELIMHGVTNPVTLDVTFNGGGFDRLRGAYVVGFEAHGEIDRAVFGVDRFQRLVSDAVEIEIYAEFKRR